MVAVRFTTVNDPSQSPSQSPSQKHITKYVEVYLMNYKEFLIRNFRGSHFTINELAERAYFDENFPKGLNRQKISGYVEEEYPHLINEFSSSWRSFMNEIDAGRKFGKNRKSIAFGDNTMERIKTFKEDNGFESDLAAIHALVLMGLRKDD